MGENERTASQTQMREATFAATSFTLRGCSEETSHYIEKKNEYLTTVNAAFTSSSSVCNY